MTGTLLRRLGLAALASLLVAACGGGESGEATTVRLGYFPNVTHAPAIVGDAQGFFAEALGEDVDLQVQYFNAGPDVIQAMFAEGLDMSFIGPNPAINGFAQSDGEAIRIIAGSTSGGAFLVVRPGITTPQDLAGATIATPQLGNTQDVALRAWLITQGLSADTAGGGDVSIRPQSNADTLNAFRAGDIDGAWVPEPWATRLILEGSGVVLVDERDLWPDGLYVTTHLIVRTEFLEQNPGIVERFLEGYLAALEFVQQSPEEAQRITNDGIEAITGARLADQTIAGAWQNLTFTWDPIASSLVGSKDDAVAAGLLDPVDLTGIYALDILNRLLAAAGEEPVAGL
ncbi:MAG: ABC transporter substrate-binding protein [Acidimicrobiia bacterium]|nr:ABC transporter substrate-binding protein [Acidimicrobiia bacterium]